MNPVFIRPGSIFAWYFPPDILFPPDIFRQLYDINVSLLLFNLLSLLILFELFRMARICWFSDFVRARLQETGSVRHTYSEYPGKTASCTRRRHGDNSTTPEQPLSWRARRPQAGCWRWMPDVVCQLVGIGMVPWYVMKWGRVSSCSMVNVLKLLLLLILIDTLLLLLLLMDTLIPINTII